MVVPLWDLGTCQGSQTIKVVSGDGYTTIIRAGGRIKLSAHYSVIAFSGIGIAGWIGYTTYTWGLGVNNRHCKVAGTGIAGSILYSPFDDSAIWDLCTSQGSQTIKIVGGNSNTAVI